MDGGDAVRQLRVVVHAAEFDAALAFYRDSLGLREEVAYQGDGGARVVILAAGRATLELANTAQVEMIDQVEVGRRVAPPIRLAFEVDDTRTTTDRLLAAGADVIAPPVVTPWRSLNARLAAPASVQLTLFEELEETASRWDRTGFGTADRHRTGEDAADSGPRRGWVQTSDSARSLPAAGGRLLASASDTGGRFTVIHTRVPPGDATPLHRHGSMDESFYVLSGALRVTCADDTFDVGTGSWVHLPRGLPHRYVAGDDGAEFLIHAVPGGLEQLFDDWDAGLDLAEAARRHDIEFLE